MILNVHKAIKEDESCYCMKNISSSNNSVSCYKIFNIIILNVVLSWTGMSCTK